MKKLTRIEMKNVLGGKVEGAGGMCGGSCIGSVGSWEYVPQNSTLAQCLNDIQTYCSSGQGSCSTNCGGPQPIGTLG